MENKKINSSGMTELAEQLRKISPGEYIGGFPAFIVREFGGADAEGQSFSQRKRTAWKNFRMRENMAGKQGKSGRCLEVAAKTKRKWFGIEGESAPRRYQIFQLAFELEFSPQETERYLKEGLGQPGIQHNDYREWMCLYGLQRHMAYGDVCGMIRQFEEEMQAEQDLEQNTHTNWLREKYGEISSLPPCDFLQWTYSHAGVFKGYSKTILHYFERYRDEIIYITKKKEQRELGWLLEQTDYEDWKKEWLTNHPAGDGKGDVDELELVRRYIRHASRRKDALNPEFCHDILNTARLAYGKESVHTMLKSLYLVSEERKDVRFPFAKLTDKRMSDILHTARHRENEMRLAWEKAGKGEDTKGRGDQRRREVEGRLVVPERSHLLPMIHYVAQAKYLETIEGKEKYVQSEAMEFFVDMANGALQACGMEQISGEYVLDYILLSTYGREEMYYLSDVMEIAEGLIP